MIYATVKSATIAYHWNLAMEADLEKDVLLSDYTALEEEFDEDTLQKTFHRVCSENEGVAMTLPTLMMVTTGFYKSCIVWVDKNELVAKPEIDDPKKDFEYYEDQE